MNSRGTLDVNIAIILATELRQDIEQELRSASDIDTDRTLKLQYLYQDLTRTLEGLKQEVYRCPVKVHRQLTMPGILCRVRAIVRMLKQFMSIV
jgi:hypothetical protein